MTTILKGKPPKTKREGKPFRAFRIEPEEDAKLEALATRHGISRSEVLRQALNFVYDQEFGAAEKSGGS